MPKILFICFGNVGRSQMAEEFYNHYTKTLDGFSAGTSKKTPKMYIHPTDDIISLMLEEKLDVSKKKIKTVTKNMVKKADIIYVLCDKEDCPDFVKKSKKAQFNHVPDPYHLQIDQARKVRDMIKALIKKLIKETKD